MAGALSFGSLTTGAGGDEKAPSADMNQHLLILPRGIAVYPNSENYPRLPLLGLRALLAWFKKAHCGVAQRLGPTVPRRQQCQNCAVVWHCAT